MSRPPNVAVTTPRDLDPRVVEAGAAADVGQRIGHQGVGGGAVQRAAPPQPLGKADGPRLHVGVHRDRALDLAQIVEHARHVAGVEVARGGVARMDLQSG